ncbi:MAG: c-type cytochrome [Parvibaculaceae bacterium]|nr:c-type cytochrome [Parvibaculaceae bacterium]
MSWKKTAIRLAAGALAALLLALAVFLTIFPRVSAAPHMMVDLSEARIKRGAYLFNNVMGCRGCHTPVIEPAAYSFPTDPARTGAGRLMGGPEDGLPAPIHSPNITPFELSGWSDGEIYRAITAGVNRQGQSLFPLMPYQAYATLDRRDIEDVIAYLRTLPSQNGHQPENSLPFPLSLLVRTAPHDAASQPRPPETDKLAYGAYLSRAAGCFDCHTQANNRNQPVGTPFAGGRAFPAHGYVIYSPNLTPDRKTGLGIWTRARFIGRFRALTPDATRQMAVPAGSPNTPMPWSELSGMTDTDLDAIFTYLKSLPPVRNDQPMVQLEPGRDMPKAAIPSDSAKN